MYQRKNINSTSLRLGMSSLLSKQNKIFMKKILFLFVSIVFLISDSFGHAYTIQRSWCGGFLYRRFIAGADIDVYAATTYNNGQNSSGQVVTQTIGHLYNVASSTDKGCSRPKIATATNGGLVNDYVYSGNYLQYTNPQPYWGNAKADFQVNSTTLTQQATGRAQAGNLGTFNINNLLFNNLNLSGLSNSNITGDVNVIGKKLIIKNLSGNIEITKGTDCFAKYSILVIKENENEISNIEELIQLGKVDNVIYKSEIIVSNGQIKKTGLFGLDANQQSFISTDNENFGVSIDNLNFEFDLTDELKENEHFTIICMVDGGLDISKAVESGSNKRDIHDIDNAQYFDNIICGPNPALDVLNLKIYSSTIEGTLKINSITASGLKSVLVGNVSLQKGYSEINNLDISKLPVGINLLEVFLNDKKYIYKIIKQNK
jgi:hypothetical protein